MTAINEDKIRMAVKLVKKLEVRDGRWEIAVNERKCGTLESKSVDCLLKLEIET